MNKIWREHFDTYLTEARERGLEPFRRGDKAHQALCARSEELRRACREIVSRLPEEEQRTLRDFQACGDELQQLEKHESYRQGHLDCARMLRRLGLWEVLG